LSAESELGERCAAVIVAAGRSERAGGIDKLWAPLAGRPLIAWTLDAFEGCPAIDSVTLVVADDAIERADALVREEGLTKVTQVCAGGATRQASVRAGLEALPGCAWVVVHDGARPFVTAKLIEATLAAARDTGAACCALPAHDTVKEVADRRIVRTLDRARLWLAQTPQGFRYDLLLDAHRRSEGGATDDATLVESLGVEVRIVPGSARNFKVTTADDLALAEALLRASCA
jgi:2-C-methyl-D-erythritol 4-phosphate cytidylyltransferase